MSNDNRYFETAFAALTGNPPFPWQRALYDRFVSDDPKNIPAACNLPTGLGKTNVLAIWLIALATHPGKMPRRLVYVVNRRTVVDQTTNEAEKLKANAEKAKVPTPVISTLRGQYADNREWSADPSRPAIICGTVDMIGSRLLFSGYGVGFKSKPLHAGFLGQDVLLVHDEAHLEPAFQELLVAIEKEQARCKEFGKFRVMELTATSRGEGEVFNLTPQDAENAMVQKRVTAKKTIHLQENRDEKKLADEMADLASKFKDSKRAILIFVRKVDDVEKITKKIKNSVAQLTGTIRGKERDELVETAIFKRFLPDTKPSDETVYLVCTSAGEVGVNISADHLICDLSTFESMAQRFGRVNRFGTFDATEIHVVHPATFGKDGKVDAIDERRQRTLELLKQLNGDGSPKALGDLPADERLAAFAPTPTILPTSDILFDAWALTSIKDMSIADPSAGGSALGQYLAVDASGDAFVGGNFSGTVDFDPGSGTHDLSSTNQSGFVLKLNTNGQFGWVSPFMAASGSSLPNFGECTIQSIALDGSGNVIVGGYYFGAVDFNPGAGTTILLWSYYSNANGFITPS